MELNGLMQWVLKLNDLRDKDNIPIIMKLKELNLLPNRNALAELPECKLLINTINAYSYNNAKKDSLFAEVLQRGDVLIPDGESIIKAYAIKRWDNAPKERCAGWDLFTFEMNKLNIKGGKCFLLGSSEKVLNLIKQRATIDFPNIQIITFSPPYKFEFTKEENQEMIDAINTTNPDLLWIGMTAPKQEKWAYSHWNELNINCHCGTIGAVFDFYAGTVKRAPESWQKLGFEWFYRLIKEPRRMWKRYIIGNILFIWNIAKE